MVISHKEESFVGLAEDVAEDVVKSVVKDIKWIVDSMMPNGLAFGQSKMNNKQKLNAYMASGLHDNPEACKIFIRTKVMELNNMLLQFGVLPELLASIHPYDIIETAALSYSAKMERLLEKETNKLIGKVTQAEAPVDQEEG